MAARSSMTAVSTLSTAAAFEPSFTVVESADGSAEMVAREGAVAKGHGRR